MKLMGKFEKVRIAAEMYVLIKYNVISDVMTSVRHVGNFIGEKITTFTSGIGETTYQVTRTTDALNYQRENIAANFTSADGDLLKMAVRVIVIFALLYKFGPSICARFRGDKEAKRGDKEAKRGDKEATRGKKESKAARFEKWAARYGGDFKTKKAAKAAFDKFEKDMGYS